MSGGKKLWIDPCNAKHRALEALDLAVEAKSSHLRQVRC